MNKLFFILIALSIAALSCDLDKEDLKDLAQAAKPKAKVKGGDNNVTVNVISVADKGRTKSDPSPKRKPSSPPKAKKGNKGIKPKGEKEKKIAEATKCVENKQSPAGECNAKEQKVIISHSDELVAEEQVTKATKLEPPKKVTKATKLEPPKKVTKATKLEPPKKVTKATKLEPPKKVEPKVDAERERAEAIAAINAKYEQELADYSEKTYERRQYLARYARAWNEVFGIYNAPNKAQDGFVRFTQLATGNYLLEVKAFERWKWGRGYITRIPVSADEINKEKGFFTLSHLLASTVNFSSTYLSRASVNGLLQRAGETYKLAPDRDAYKSTSFVNAGCFYETSDFPSEGEPGEEGGEEELPISPYVEEPNIWDYTGDNYPCRLVKQVERDEYNFIRELESNKERELSELDQ